MKDIDLVAGLITIQGKGGKRAIMPIGFTDLRNDLFLHISGEGREPDEYLLYPKAERTWPMDLGSVHRWFKNV